MGAAVLDRSVHFPRAPGEDVEREGEFEWVYLDNFSQSLSLYFHPQS